MPEEASTNTGEPTLMGLDCLGNAVLLASMELKDTSGLVPALMDNGASRVTFNIVRCVMRVRWPMQKKFSVSPARAACTSHPHP